MYFATLIHDELHKEHIDVLGVQRFLLFRSEVSLYRLRKTFSMLTFIQFIWTEV